MTIILQSDRDAVWRAIRKISEQKQKQIRDHYYRSCDQGHPSTPELIRETGLKRGRLMRILRDLVEAHRVRRWVVGSRNTYYWEAGFPIHHSFYKWSMLRMATPVESDCARCIHVRVCDRNHEKRCSNYEMGDSRFHDCNGCLHRYTRSDPNSIPCFYCVDELPKEAVA